MTLEQFDVAVLLGAAVLLIGIAAVRLSVGTGLPSLLLYVGLGLLLGPEGLGAEIENLETARTLGYAALIVILAEGGLTTPWSQLRPAAGPAIALAVVGVIVSTVVTAAAVRAVFDVDWRFALVLGAAVASTDSAAVFSVLRRVPLPPRLAGILEAESGFNDATAVILVVAFSTEMPDGATDLLLLIATLGYELAVGAVLGIGIGRVGAAAVRRMALPASGLYPIAVLTLALAAYAAAAVLDASGFLAVYVAALVLGNARLPHGPAVRGFAEGLAWLAQIGLFVMLGLLVPPSAVPSATLPAFAVGFALLLLARPLSVLVSVLPFRIPVREQLFLSWAGLRGAVPIVLATIPVVNGVPGSRQVLHTVFVLVVVFTILQAPPLPWIATRMGLVAAAEARDIDVESSPLARLGADLLELRIPENSQLHGVGIFELRLPVGAAVTMIIRDGRAFVPTSTTTLRHGDEVLVVARSDLRQQTEERLRAVSRAGRLAGWYGERG